MEAGEQIVTTELPDGSGGAGDALALRREAWLATDAAYKNAVQLLARKQAALNGDKTPRPDDWTPVQTHDVPSMVLGGVGLPSLPGAVHTAGLQVSELYWSRWRDLQDQRYGKRFDRIRRAFRRGPYKLLVGSDGVKEAYDLSQDPAEAVNLIGAPWSTPLQADAASWEASQIKAPAAALDDHVDMGALKALGYAD